MIRFPALWDFNSTLTAAAMPLALAALVGAVAVVAFRTDVMKRWLTGVSAVIALLLLSPVNYIFAALGILWVGVISVVLYLDKTTPTVAE